MDGRIGTYRESWLAFEMRDSSNEPEHRRYSQCSGFAASLRAGDLDR